MDCAACKQPLAEGADECDQCGQPTSDPWIGKTLGDRYRLDAPLGRGGMGAVYRAEHLLMKKEMAIKVLHAELGRSGELVKRFEREAQSASHLAHPNIIQVTDFGRTDEGALYLVMELLIGEPLTALIERGPVAPERACAILIQILRALEHAHDERVIHRDLKPDNVFLVRRDNDDPLELAAGGRVKLLDFGIAKASFADAPRESITQAGVVFGTPEYLSPEQAIGEEADGRADLYAAGIMLYELLAGRRPFVADSKVALISMHLTKAPPPLREAAPGVTVPPALERVVQRALEKKRDLRYPTAGAFRDDLLKAISGSGPEVALAPPVTAPRWVRASSSAVSRALDATVLRAERAGVPYPRAVVLATGALAAATLLFLSILMLRPTPVPRPAPPPPAQAADLARAEELLSRGDLPAARAALQQQLSAHPGLARVHYLLGNLHFAEGSRDQALADYRDAVHLDPGYRGDATLLSNGRLLLDHKQFADSALSLLADEVGSPALPRLIDCAKNCRDLKVRRSSADAVIKLGGAGALPKEAASTDADLARLVGDLESGRSCKDRKRAVIDLRDLGDARAVEPLKRAKDRRGGFLGIERVNACASREIDEALRVLGGGP